MKIPVNKLYNNLKSLTVWEIIFLVLLLVLTIFTRFYNLGYSDYIGDEHKAFYQPLQGQSIFNFFMEQRKGPMQFFVSYLPYLVTHNFRLELAERIPFAIISVAAVLVFYLFVKKLTENRTSAMLAAFLLSFNGFIVGFGRIAQYQNLNLLFSFLALYFYLDVFRPENNSKIMKSSLWGTIFWSLSVLSHWDAIFILPVVVVFFVKFLKSENFSRQEKTNLILKNFLLGSFILLPFLLPYSYFQFHYPANKEYFSRRIEFGHINFERYLLLFRLYNPILFTPVVFIFGLAGFYFWKSSYPLIIWFTANYLIFEIFVRKPGTHVYNFVIPLLILTTVTFSALIQAARGLSRFIWIILITGILVFLFYQTSLLFVDHRVEYPRDQKIVFDLTKLQNYFYNKKRVEEEQRNYIVLATSEYTLDEKLPLFGFPHKRYWNEINDYINSQNEQNDSELGYITNEDKTISEWYMDAKYNLNKNFYIIGIRKPLSFVDDSQFPQIGNKTNIKEFFNDYGDTVTTIYLVKSH